MQARPFPPGLSRHQLSRISALFSHDIIWQRKKKKIKQCFLTMTKFYLGFSEFKTFTQLQSLGNTEVFVLFKFRLQWLYLRGSKGCTGSFFSILITGDTGTSLLHIFITTVNARITICSTATCASLWRK